MSQRHKQIKQAVKKIPLLISAVFTIFSVVMNLIFSKSPVLYAMLYYIESLVSHNASVSKDFPPFRIF